MTVATTLFEFDDTYARAVPRLSQPWKAEPVRSPELLVLNEELVAELGVESAALREPSGVALLVSQVPEGVPTVAQVYAGHQFGMYVPRLGDGRALLLGEVVDTARARVVGMPSACIASPIKYSRSIGPTAARPSPPRANGVRPEPFRCRSRRRPAVSTTSPSSSARPSPRRGTYIPNWWPA